MVETVKIRGMQELYRALSTTIPQNMEGKVLQAALAAGTKLVYEDARVNAVRGGAFPKMVTGTLHGAIYHARSKFDNSPTFESRVVGVRKGKRAAKKGRDAWYARLVEYGHRKASGKGGRLVRDSRALTEKGLARYAAKRSGGRIKGTASFGDVPAHPFMRPAWDKNKERALDAILQGLDRQLKKAAQRARW